ncbi:MAG: GDP-mannose 4,6-dehydratase [Nanoarchaeota archaeon]
MDGEEVLITGGLGFVGSNLAIKCHSLGAKITILNNNLNNLKNVKEIKNKINIVQGDVTNYSDIENIIKDKSIIFHLAGQTSHITSMENPHLDINVNLKGTMNILENCKNNNSSAKIIFAGTVTQLGVAKSLPINENMKDNPLSIYETDKLICEKYLQIYHKAHNLYTTTIRFSTIFGERQQLNNPRFGITTYFIGRVLKGEEITVYGDGKFIRDYNYIQNVVDALILSAQNSNANGETFCLGTNRKIYFIDMVKEVIKTTEEIIGKKGSFKFVDFPKGHKKIDVGDTLVDYNKIKSKIGWEPKISFEEGIRKTVLFYKDRWGDYPL